MKRFTIWGLLLAFLAVTFPLAAAPAIPNPSKDHFYVLDKANVLSDAAENRIQVLSSRLAGKTTAQVVVVTVPTLEDTPVEEYAQEILRSWHVGDKQLDNGVVILVAVGERRSRIETGYGLEGALPDGKTGRIQDQYMAPYFKNNDFEQGILEGYTAIVNEVATEYKVTLADRRTDRDPFAGLPWWSKILLGVGLVGLIIVDMMFFGGQFTWLLLSIFLRGGRGGGSGGGGSGGGGPGGGGGSSRDW